MLVRQGEQLFKALRRHAPLLEAREIAREIADGIGDHIEYVVRRDHRAHVDQPLMGEQYAAGQNQHRRQAVREHGREKDELIVFAHVLSDLHVLFKADFALFQEIFLGGVLLEVAIAERYILIERGQLIGDSRFRSAHVELTAARLSHQEEAAQRGQYARRNKDRIDRCEIADGAHERYDDLRKALQIGRVELRKGGQIGALKRNHLAGGAGIQGFGHNAVQLVEEGLAQPHQKPLAIARPVQAAAACQSQLKEQQERPHGQQPPVPDRVQLNRGDDAPQPLGVKQRIDRLERADDKAPRHPQNVVCRKKPSCIAPSIARPPSARYSSAHYDIFVF